MDRILEALIEFVAAIAIALLLRRFVGMFAIVKGRSMMDTLRNGDVLLVLRRGLCGGLRRFDVVLCRYPNRREFFVKRIVALPGERVAVEGDVLQINGAPVEEGFPRKPMRRDMVERKLGAGEYFVMGDNRPSSRDSRSVGAITEGMIVGVAKCVVFPLRRIKKL